MSLYRTQNISQEKLLAIAANILDKAFFDSSRVLAKRRFHALEKGDRVFLVNVAMEDRSELSVDVRLDRREARGQYNFTAFRDLVGQLLLAVSQTLKAKQAPPVFSSADGRRWNYLIPAIQRGVERDDMLIMGLDGRRPGALTIELMFIDPSQFQSQATSAG
jgi:hypothetical protein